MWCSFSSPALTKSLACAQAGAGSSAQYSSLACPVWCKAQRNPSWHRSGCPCGEVTPPAAQHTLGVIGLGGTGCWEAGAALELPGAVWSAQLAPRAGAGPARAGVPGLRGPFLRSCQGCAGTPPGPGRHSRAAGSAIRPPLSRADPKGFGVMCVGKGQRVLPSARR